MLKIPIVGKVVQKARAKAEETARMAVDGTLHVGPPTVKMPILPMALRRNSITKVAPSLAFALPDTAGVADPDTIAGKDGASESDEKRNEELRRTRSQRIHTM